MYKCLLVVADGSDHSYKVLDHAASIAEKFDSELILLTVIPTIIAPFLPDNYDPIIYEEVLKYKDKMMKNYHNMLKDAEEMVSTKHPNLNIRTILREGRPSATISRCGARAQKNGE